MTRNWPVNQTMEDLLRQQDRRLTRNERRATPIAASDLLGPGMSSQAVHILDWNDEIATFNGFLYSSPGAHNAPVVEVWEYDPVTGMPIGEPEEIDDLPWTGMVIAREDGTGMQQVWNTDEPESMFFRVRNYWPNPDDPESPVIFGEWQRFATPTGWIEGDDLAPEVQQGIQEIYDLADAAATEAYVIATATTISQTAANGKSKVTYSPSGPGSTANNAGDIWFQKDVATQTIIGQWEGMGGTTWSSKTLRNEVIANLDAGKLVAGSSFISALWVKSVLTLGDASTNGAIQSHDFAGSSTGVYMDKNGLTAKGGTITGASIIGVSITGTSSITGATFQTSASGTAGPRVVIDTVSGTGAVRLFDGTTAIGILYANAGGGGFTGPALTYGGGIGTGQYVVVSSGGPAVVGGSVLLNSTSGSTVVAGGALLVNNAGVTSGVEALQVTGRVKADSFRMAVSQTGGTTANTFTDTNGVMFRITSSLRYKDPIGKADMSGYIDALRKVDVEAYSRKNDPDAREEIGLYAERLHDMGLTPWVMYDEDGRPDGVGYDRLVLPLLEWIKRLERRVAALESR